MKEAHATYYCFNEKGNTVFPTALELAKLRADGLEVTFLLDSCICLDMVKFVNHKQKALVNKAALFHYLKYQQKHSVESIAILALLKLSSDRHTLTFTSEKLLEFKNKIDFLTQIPIDYLKRYQFDFEENYFIFKRPALESTSLESLKPLLLLSYCSLLKIRHLAMSGLGKEHARKNMDSFVTWMTEKLNRIMGLELQLAMNIFGGRSEFRRMVWLEGNAQMARKKLWGTAWDIFHSRISCDNYHLSMYFGKDRYAYFVTADGALFKLMSQLSRQLVLSSDQNGVGIYSASFEFPHFQHDYLESYNRRMLDLLGDRILQKIDYNSDSLMDLIDELEELNNIMTH